MSKPKPLICPQCGGSINRTTYICEYCGTQFKKEHDAFEPIQFEVLHPGTHVLALQTRIPEEMIYQMGAQEAGEFALKRLAEQFAVSLIPYMDVKTCTDEQDFLRSSTTMRARIRVIDPAYKF